MMEGLDGVGLRLDRAEREIVPICFPPTQRQEMQCCFDLVKLKSDNPDYSKEFI